MKKRKMAKKEKEIKTNAMRILERLKIPFTYTTYEAGEFVDGLQTAQKLSLPVETVFKTLICVGNDRQHYVFVIPVAAELDLKKCAKSVGVKSVSMIHVKELFDLTGYVRGGCTAIGMKKQFVTRVDQSASKFEQIHISGGRLGSEITLAPDGLLKAAGAEYAELVLI